MLSYQHIYHAGNWADVHKHWLLSATLTTLKSKPKPLFYMETHAGRGLYDLRSAEAQKTQEAAQGITRAVAHSWLPAQSPYAQVLNKIHHTYGPDIYPGSPLIARHILDEEDTLILAELHPQEHAALEHTFARLAGHIHPADGYKLLQSMMPPTPRRGLVLIDPSYELKTEYIDLPKHVQRAAKAWNVGNFLIWYPILTDARHHEMIDKLTALFPEGGYHEVRFPPARDGHRMVGSGMFYNRDIFGVETARAHISAFFHKLQATP